MLDKMRELARNYQSREINVRQLEMALRYGVKEHGGQAVAHALDKTVRADAFRQIVSDLFQAAAKTRDPQVFEVIKNWFEDGRLSNNVSDAIAEYGSEALPYLLAYATSGHDPLRRVVALKTLAKIKEPDAKADAAAVKKIARIAAGDPNSLVRKVALETVHAKVSLETPPETLANVTELLLRSRPEQEHEVLVHQMALNRVLSYAQTALRGNTSEEANQAAYKIAEAVAKATARPDDFMRGIAANMLGKLGVHGGRHAHTLAFLATNPSTAEGVRRDAAAALASVAEDASPQFVNKISESLAEAMPREENPLTIASMAETLHKLGKPGQEKLWKLFHHPDETGRIAAYWLGKTPANMPKLLRFLHDPSPLNQARAAAGLGSMRFAPPKVDAELALAATDETRAPEVRKEAARSLVLRGKPRVAKQIFDSIERGERRSRLPPERKP